MSSVRLSTAASDGKANLHQGAVGVGLDIATGRAMRAVQFDRPVTHHPDTGADQPIGERGELWVRGPQVMKGYLNNPEATAATIDDDGWLHTGDIAIIDEHGHMTIVDRLKELIKFKGFQVAPAELEALIVTHPKVADVAVIGVPDDEAGEIPKAFVAAVPGETVTLEEIQELVAEHLVSYKQIKQLEVLDAIPKSASGKILRKDLRTR